MPAISIIVPVYQAENTLSTCIDSILNQTFSDFELILLNDGSTDNSGAICNEYCKKDSRIKVVHQDNCGVSATRNKGISMAEGKYIMFCDSDDYVHPNWCEYMHTVITHNPDLFCVCDVTKVPYDNVVECSPEDMSECKYFNSYYELYITGMSTYTVTKIYDVAKISAAQIRFNVGRTFAEDAEFNVEYYKQCNGAVSISNKLYYYRSNPNSLMNVKYDDFFPIYSFPFSVRLPLIEKEHIPQYCDIWFSDFHNMFSYIFQRKDLSYMKKLKYNQKILNSDEFQFVLKNMLGERENSFVLRLLRTNCYYLYWLFEKTVKIKNRLFKR